MGPPIGRNEFRLLPMIGPCVTPKAAAFGDPPPPPPLFPEAPRPARGAGAAAGAPGRAVTFTGVGGRAALFWDPRGGGEGEERLVGFDGGRAGAVFEPHRVGGRPTSPPAISGCPPNPLIPQLCPRRNPPPARASSTASHRGDPIVNGSAPPWGRRPPSSRRSRRASRPLWATPRRPSCGAPPPPPPPPTTTTTTSSPPSPPLGQGPPATRAGPCPPRWPALWNTALGLLFKGGKILKNAFYFLFDPYFWAPEAPPAGS